MFLPLWCRHFPCQLDGGLGTTACHQLEFCLQKIFTNSSSLKVMKQDFIQKKTQKVHLKFAIMGMSYLPCVHVVFNTSSLSLVSPPSSANTGTATLRGRGECRSPVRSGKSWSCPWRLYRYMDKSFFCHKSLKFTAGIASSQRIFLTLPQGDHEKRDRGCCCSWEKLWIWNIGPKLIPSQ